ncbi:MAG: glutamate ligase domain-containing protein, partial [Vulcanimicrobiaceae bacterium]
YDAYNASLSGTVATLAAFAAEPAQRRIAILGGMAELGDDSPRFHEQAGAAVGRNGIDVLLAGGAHADATVRGALEAGMPESAVLPYNDNGVAIAWLREHLREGDCVLLKGSRMYKMEEILVALQ